MLTHLCRFLDIVKLNGKQSKIRSSPAAQLVRAINRGCFRFLLRNHSAFLSNRGCHLQGRQLSPPLLHVLSEEYKPVQTAPSFLKAIGLVFPHRPEACLYFLLTAG